MSRDAWVVVLVVVGLLAAATLVGAVVLGIRLLRTRKLLGELGADGKVAFYGALIYTIFPIDLLPDPIYLDDMGVLAASAVYLTRLARRRQAERASSGSPSPRNPNAAQDVARSPQAGRTPPGR